MNITQFLNKEEPLADNERIKIKGGRTLYRFAGSMWRPNSDLNCFVSHSVSSKERFIPWNTQIEIVKVRQG